MTQPPTATMNLLPRVAAGEAGMADAMIAQYGGLVWTLARRFLMNDADAEDAAQDIFLELWRMADRFNPAISSETTFVAMIARRRLIDRRRRAQRGPKISSDDKWVASKQFATRAPDAVSDEVRLAAAALQSCSQVQQDVLRLNLLDGMSHDRIAQALDIPLGTVKTHARRGLLRLRDALGAKMTRGSEVAS